MTRPIRHRARLVGAAIAVAVLTGAAAVLGAEHYEGTFGVTGTPKSCGSVWGLPTVDDLNAASCVPGLRTRVTLVAILIGVALAIAALAAIDVVSARTSAPRHRAAWSVFAVVASGLVSTALIVIGRHFIWSVSGA
jgi:hypothetical protein